MVVFLYKFILKNLNLDLKKEDSINLFMDPL